MVNSQVMREISDELKIDERIEKIPNPIPVVEVGLKLSKTAKVASGVMSATGTLAIIPSSGGLTSRGDVYLTGLSCSLIKDAACDAATGTIFVSCTIDGASYYITAIPIIALTAQSENRNISFSHPIKLDKNTAVAFTSTYAAGVMVRACSIYYYTDEII